MYKVERAIILAAGVGSRMRPVTLKTPKPLVKINGVRIIETIIRGLRDNDITEIYVVVGYLKEQFAFLPKEYPGLQLVENPYYETRNNISSLYVVREHLENSLIIYGDQMVNNPTVLRPEFEKSGFNCRWTETVTKEWLMMVKDNTVTDCIREGGAHGWEVFGVSRWSSDVAAKLKSNLEMEFEQRKSYHFFWEEVVLFDHLHEFDLGIMEMNFGDIIEID